MFYINILREPMRGQPPRDRDARLRHGHRDALPGPAVPARRLGFGVDGGTWLEHRVWARVPSACPRWDRTPVRRELATSQPWSLIPIFAAKPPRLLCPLPWGSRFWLLSGTLRNYPCTERASPMVCVILLCLHRGRLGCTGGDALRGALGARMAWLPMAMALRGGETLWGFLYPSGALVRQGWG